MDSIVKKLSEIESAASAIVQHAEEQKESLDREYRQKRTSFDEDLESRTMAQINQIRSDLEHDTQALLKSQSGNNSDTIVALQKEYEEKHTQYAQDILKRITEV